MDTVRLPKDTNGNPVAVAPLDDEESVVLELGSGSIVSPVLNRGMYEIQLFELGGAAVWMQKTDDEVAAGPYKGRVLFPGSDGVQFVPGGRRLGFTADAALGWSEDSAAVIVLVPVAEAQ